MTEKLGTVLAEGKHNTESMRKSISDFNLTRQSFEYYKKLKKKELLKSFQSFVSNFDQVRHKLVELQLENNYLKRRNQLIEEQLVFYKRCYMPRRHNKGVSIDKRK